jgi:hypothetical protein
LVDFVLIGKYRLPLPAGDSVDWQSFFFFPTLDCPDISAQILRYLTPRVESFASVLGHGLVAPYALAS